MLSCRHIFWFLLMIVILLEIQQSWAKPITETAAFEQIHLPQSFLITDDVIHDTVERDNKKVIRVSPLDLPALIEDPEALNKDSVLYNIQNLKPYNGKRKYINMQRSRPLNEAQLNSAFAESPIIRGGLSLVSQPDKTLKPQHRSKRKHLHFLYNQQDLAGNLLAKNMQVHVAAGAYPVYYLIARTNGHFGKYPLKSFSSPQAFMKYLQKNKLEKPTAFDTYEEAV